MAGQTRLYLKLFGKPGFCFQTPAGSTDMLPLPTPLWAMLLAYLATCERQTASLETLLAIWNETRNEETRDPAQVYGAKNEGASPEIAKAALANAVAETRRQLMALHKKYVGTGGDADDESAVDACTFLPKQLEQTLYLDAQTVDSDVARFGRLCREIGRMQNSSQGNEAIQQKLEEAKALYTGEFLKDGDFYFGRANSRIGGKYYRPWIERERVKLAAQFEEIQDRLRESSRHVFQSIPSYLDRFVDRPALMRQVTAWLLSRGEFGDQAILLLHGAGGAGKTRLASAAVRGLQEAALRTYDKRIHFISFIEAPQQASVSDLAFMLARAADAPKSVQGAEPREVSARLRTWLAQSPLRLFILDNFETMTVGNEEAGAWLIALARNTNGQARCLITSQHVFTPRLPHYAVGGMALPVSADREAFDASESNVLYQGRIRETPRFRDMALPESRRKALRELFSIVDGLPLAIEMLASRCAEMTVAQLKETAAVLGKEKRQIDFLYDAEPDALRSHRRHAGMRALLAWTWEHLLPEDKMGLTWLAVFPGSFTAEAAHEVCAVSEIQLERYKSLALTQCDPETRRWSLLPMVAEYAREHFASEPDTAKCLYAAFSLYYRDVLEGVSPQFQTKQFRNARRVVAADEINFVRAQTYCAAHRFNDSCETMVRLAQGLRPYRSLTNDRHRSTIENEDALQNCEAYGPPRWYQTALRNMIEIQTSLNRSDRLPSLYNALEAICLETGSRTPSDIRALGLASREVGKQTSLLEEAIRLYNASENHIASITTMERLACARHNSGDFRGGFEVYNIAFPKAIEIGWYGVATMASNRAQNAKEAGEFAVAEQMFRVCLELSRKDNLLLTASWALFNYGLFRGESGHLRECARLFKYAENIRCSIDSGLEGLNAQEEAILVQLKREIGEMAYEEERALAATADMDIAVRYALSLTPLA